MIETALMSRLSCYRRYKPANSHFKGIIPEYREARVRSPSKGFKIRYKKGRVNIEMDTLPAM